MNFKKTTIKWGITLLTLALISSIAFYPLPQQPPIKYVDRASGEVKTEKVAGEKWLEWLYNNPLGELSLWALAKRKVVSSVYGNMMDSPSSAEKIQPFVEDFNINLSEAQKQEFDSFNDFFTRKLKAGTRPVDTASLVVISPADGKVLAYTDISNTDFIIKGFRFDVYSFLDDSILAQNYVDGSLIVIRLAPNDYHRFHFPLGGKASPLHRIKGDYYSVNPIALRKMVEIFVLNKREFIILSNPVFGDVVMMEVGATMVGSIVQTYQGEEVIKGQEKGFFKFGGSTVVLLFEKGEIQIDTDLVANTKNGFETSILAGQRIGGVSQNN
ncbi:MAG: phosphatidylserine decarboxylase [Bacteroidales bacterium]|nr:phosphatidylserine decarboxylase [Bacteroidales bacterium]